MSYGELWLQEKSKVMVSYGELWLQEKSKVMVSYGYKRRVKLW